jgi:hypothetical protein
MALTPSGNRDAEQLFGRQAERVFLIHRRDIVEPVEIWQRLQIGFVLDKLFSAAMEQADVRIDALDHLAVELQDQAQHAVCRRVLRSEIDREIAERSLGHADFFRFAGTETPSTWICSANAPIGEAYDALLRGRNDADVEAALPRLDQRKVHRRPCRSPASQKPASRSL